MKEFIGEQGITYELVPPGDHRKNLAERAIQTAKAHFNSIMCGVSKTFPMHLWCRLLPQVELTLNLLRQSKVAPKLSAYAHLYGVHNFLKVSKSLRI